jgi:hypothetical protein
MLACDFFHVDYVGHPAAPGPVLRDRMSTRRVHVLEVTAHPGRGVDHSAGIETVKIPLRSRCRNWVGTVRAEVTNRMLIADPRHPRAVLDEYVAHHDRHRPHRARDLRPPDSGDSVTVRSPIWLWREWR